MPAQNSPILRFRADDQTAAIVRAVANTRCEGNVSMAIRIIVSEWYELHPAPPPKPKRNPRR